MKLLAFHDATMFGGHEIMTLRLLPGLLDDPRLTRLAFAYPAANAELGRRLAALGHGKLAPLPWRWEKRAAEPWLRPLRLRYARAVRALHAAERPDRVLIVQGRIENGVVPMTALPDTAWVASYIPMAHGMREIGRRGGPGDHIRRRLYRRPDRFLVPSASVAAQLARAGARGAATVVPNIVETAPAIDRAAARETLGLPADRRLALFLGRFDTAQKGLDVLADAIRRDAAALSGWTLLFVGDGEGWGAIERLADGLSGRVDIRVAGFTSDGARWRAAADALLLPSRWEGVPLVMLEAMADGLPILASRIDVFAEHLPEPNLADFARVDLAAALDAVVGPAAVTAFREAARGMAGSLARSRALFADGLLA